MDDEGYRGSSSNGVAQKRSKDRVAQEFPRVGSVLVVRGFLEGVEGMKNRVAGAYMVFVKFLNRPSSVEFKSRRGRRKVAFMVVIFKCIARNFLSSFSMYDY